MDQVTQQNAALVEQAAAAADAMQQQAANLMQLVSVFKLGAGAAYASASDGMKEQKAIVHNLPAHAAKKVSAPVPKKQVANGAEEWEEF
jgi:methyl-accepting chemotaxis protein